jgi:hypothetical protein
VGWIPSTRPGAPRSHPWAVSRFISLIRDSELVCCSIPHKTSEAAFEAETRDAWIRAGAGVPRIPDTTRLGPRLGPSLFRRDAMARHLDRARASKQRMGQASQHRCLTEFVPL